MLRLRPDGAVELDVHAVPKSSRDAIGPVHGDRLKLHVKAPPVDGEANAALIRLLAKTLGLPRDAIEISAGATGKRKTVRIRGRSLDEVATALGLTAASPICVAALTTALLTAALLTSACTEPRELPITVILPADTSDYEQADNATVIMRPSGDSFTFDVSGLDFALELEGTPTTEVQQLELYLARGDELLAWGSTVGFATAGPDVGLALFLGRPGRLSTWPETIDAPDPDTLIARAIGRGMLLVESDGDTLLLSEYTLEIETGKRMPASNAFAPDDGVLVGAADGSVVRLAFEQTEPIAWRYDPSDDAWTELLVDAAADIGMRPGAAALVDPDQSRVYLLGGGGATDAVAIDLVPDADERLAAAPVSGVALDRPRDGATALWIGDDDSPTADVLLVGGDTPGPVAVRANVGTSFGPSLRWSGTACAMQTDDTADGIVLCVGGSVDDVATADALQIQLAMSAVERRESFLPAALGDPLLLGDAFALYAQGAGRMFRIARDDASVSEPESAARRSSGGGFVQMSNGVTFLVGGLDPDGAAVDQWQVFTPAVEP